MLSLEKLLKTKAGNGLEKIVHRAQDMDDMTHKLRAKLEPDLAAQILAVNVRDGGELVIVCGSSAWAARIRFEGDALLSAARELDAGVTRCRVKVLG